LRILDNGRQMLKICLMFQQPRLPAPMIAKREINRHRDRRGTTIERKNEK